MAERRMFAKTIIDSDAFLEMPVTAQLLYFHLSMRADDDGFINKPKSIMRMIGAKEDDINILFARKFVIPFDSGVVVIKHWKIHNFIQKDRYSETKYKEEKSMLTLDENKAYRICVNDMDTDCYQVGNETDTQVRLGKDRLDKDNISSLSAPDKPKKHKYGVYKHVLLTDEEYDLMFKRFGEPRRMQLIEKLDEAIEEHGYKYKNHYLTMTKADSWVLKEVTGVSSKGGATKGQTRGTDYDAIMLQGLIPL